MDNNKKYADRLEEIIRNVPYTIWEKIINGTVDKVIVERWNNGSIPGRADLVVATIKSGADEYFYSNFTTIDGINEKLAVIWKPYRDWLEEVESVLKSVLEQPVKYEKAVITEKEFNARIENLEFGFKRHTQKNEYIKKLGLTGYLKKKCYREEYVDTTPEIAVQREAMEVFSCIVDYVIDHTDEADMRLILKKYDIDTEESLEIIKELMNYLFDCAGDKEKWTGRKVYKERVSAALYRFLYQEESIESIYKTADDVVEAAFNRCGRRERDYCLALGIDKTIRREIITLSEKYGRATAGRYWNGYRKGMFEGYVGVLFNKEKEILSELLNEYENSQVLTDLYTRIIATHDEYLSEMNKTFEDYEKIENEETDSEGNIQYYVKLPEWDISVGAETKEGALNLARDQFKAYRSEILINRFLEIDEYKGCI